MTDKAILARSICTHCRYGRRIDMGENGTMLTACLYILKTGKRRPCPVGEDCTVYEPRGKRDFTEGWFEGK